MKPGSVSLALGLASLLTTGFAQTALAGFHLPQSVVLPQQAPANMNHSALEQRGAQLVGAIHLRGVVNSLSEGSVNVSHEANQRIGWPAMTMDLPLAPYAAVTPDLEPGMPVTLMLTMSDLGSYRVASIVPDEPTDDTPEAKPDSALTTDDGVPVL
ncbi:copper-binding protein [uncultured Roseibium sp.]|uniref:copper-binding protein n=1 Tax=uncultured Roseibium sp. TaxID=1936171 RepID=UPI002624BC6E|nr:copper-binding protein [uncultured Roseibium sp.]